jgi:hypothetical protein
MLIIAAVDVRLQLPSDQETIHRNGFQSDEKNTGEEKMRKQSEGEIHEAR